MQSVRPGTSDEVASIAPENVTLLKKLLRSAASPGYIDSMLDNLAPLNRDKREFDARALVPTLSFLFCYYG